MPTSSSASYSNYVLSLQLTDSIGPDRFMATREDYRRRLGQSTMPREVKSLLTQLFERGAIIKCIITFGRRLELELPQQDSRGRTLLSYQALNHFKTAFTEITGRHLTTTAPDLGGSNRERPGRSGGGYSRPPKGLGDAVSDVIESIFEAIGSIFK